VHRFKAKSGHFEALKDISSLQELAPNSNYILHFNYQVAKTAEAFGKNADLAFGSKTRKEDSRFRGPGHSTNKIGQVASAERFFKEKPGPNEHYRKEKDQKVVRSHPRLNLVQQCKLPGYPSAPSFITGPEVKSMFET